jgi:hypothetical protein
MRIFIFLISIVAAYSTTVLGEDDCRCWTPNAQQIASLEEKIASRPMPLGNLDRYARYYEGTIFGTSDRIIRGKFVPLAGNETPGVHIVEGRMQPLQGEGCTSSFILGVEQSFHFICAWIPSDSQVAEVEDLLRQQQGRGHEYVKYARHYTGIIEGERRIILGIFERFNKKPPGVYVGSMSELPGIAGGGCGVLHVKFDPSNKQLDVKCNSLI